MLPTLEITQFGTMLVMSNFANFIEMVEMRTRAAPDRTAFIILENGERESERVTFTQLGRVSTI
jgi:acyl-CoA synthetase (AMP-forming)/AMP-acid ligase II